MVLAMKRWIVGMTLLAAALIATFIYINTDEQRWRDRCHVLGGQTEHRLIGMVPAGKAFVPIFSRHCWVAGHEVKA